MDEEVIMGKILNKLEKKIGKYAIKNLSLYLIIGYVIGYALSLTGSLSFLSLDPDQVLKGQVWRIVTWILMPPSSLNIFTIIMLFFYYSLGTSLERTWGTFRYNAYLFSGMLFTLIGSFVIYFLLTKTGLSIYLAKEMATLDLKKYGLFVDSGVPAEVVGGLISIAVSTYYINLSIFLAFASSYPDMRVLLYFVIPVKIKWLAWVDIAVLLYDFIKGPVVLTLPTKVTIVMSLLNFLLFFFSTRNFSYIKPSEVHRRATFKRQTSTVANTNSITKHKCAICGRTEKDGDDLEFRFCSKCNGNYEYCNEHLFSHKHIM